MPRSRSLWPHVLSLVLVFAAVPLLGHSDPARPDRAASVERVRGLDPRVAVKLRAGHKLAARRLGTHPPCRALFAERRQSGAAVISNMEFAVGDGAACAPGVAATTSVGGSVTRLCRASLPRLDRYQIATLLIHEALHQAGLSEWPHDPEGLTSQQINRLVSSRCGL